MNCYSFQDGPEKKWRREIPQSRVLCGALTHLLCVNRKMKQSKNIQGLLGIGADWAGTQKEKAWKFWLKGSWEKAWERIYRHCWAVRCSCPGACAGIRCKHPLENIHHWKDSKQTRRQNDLASRSQLGCVTKYPRAGIMIVWRAVMEEQDGACKWAW